MVDLQDYQYKLPKVGHPRTWRGKTNKSPRWFWFHLTLEDGTIIVHRKELTWTGACHFGDALFATTQGADVLFLLDGKLPESLINFPPTDAVWNRWEKRPFLEDGKHCVQVAVGRQGSIELGAWKPRQSA